MGCICVNIYRKCCCCPSQSTGTYAGSVDLLQHLFLQFFYIRDLRMFINRSGQSLLRQQSTFFKSAADTHSHHHRRTSIRSGILYGCKDCVFHTFYSIRRLQHKHPAHIFTSKTFRCNSDSNAVSGNNTVMNDCRCIIPGIFTINRISYHRFTQISIHVSAANSLVHSIFHISAYKMNVLTYFQKHHGHTGVLADRNHIFLCNFHIFL